MTRQTPLQLHRGLLWGLVIVGLSEGSCLGHDCFPSMGGLAAQSVLFSAPVVVGAFEFLVTIAIRNCSRVAHAHVRFRTLRKRLKRISIAALSPREAAWPINPTSLCLARAQRRTERKRLPDLNGRPRSRRPAAHRDSVLQGVDREAGL